MSTITDIRTVGITIADQDKAIAFYRDTLGFDVRLDVDGPTRWVEVAPARWRCLARPRGRRPPGGEDQ